MTDRHTADTITSDALDKLYERVEFYEAALNRMRDRAEVTVVRVHKALASFEGRGVITPEHVNLDIPTASEVIAAVRAALVASSNPAVAVEVRQPCPYCGDRQMIPRSQYDEHVMRLHPDVKPIDPEAADQSDPELRRQLAAAVRALGASEAENQRLRRVLTDILGRFQRVWPGAEPMRYQAVVTVEDHARWTAALNSTTEQLCTVESPPQK
ncbi:hypothetical protein ACFVT5_41020 [Streptomyces sp. NPDC058001]|uniref:hypothetical protein n=1 Tax=Streptomyces sp. NPDC058001 TaxID=3346300 RepID=UPI0036E1FD51